MLAAAAKPVAVVALVAAWESCWDLAMETTAVGLAAAAAPLVVAVAPLVAPAVSVVAP